jgi:hypothetical protein
MAMKVSSFSRNTIADSSDRFNEIGWKTGVPEQLVAIPCKVRYTIVIGYQENTPC